MPTMPANRRNLLQYGALTTATGAAPTLAGADHDPHAEWLHLMDELQAYAEEAFTNDPEGRKRYAAFSREHIGPLEERISRTPARTAKGAAAQLRLFLQIWECEAELCEEHPHRSTIATRKRHSYTM